MVKVTALRKIFTVEQGTVRAVEGVNFDVGRGEFFTLLGPSGSGKSTILRCIAGLEIPEGGEITIGEKTVFSSQTNRFVPPNERDISMVFQSYAIWPHMTVYENVAYPLLGNMPKKLVYEKTMESLKMVSLEKFEKRAAPLLSGGQQQRVALARAIAKEAKALLLDEPLSNLDARLRLNMRLELREVQKRLGITAIYVTHDQEEALAISDRIAVLNEGEIIEIGPPLSIYQRPTTPFVAAFIGLCNMLRGKITERQYPERSIAETNLGKLECVASERGPTDVLIAIRPEYIEVSPERFPHDRNVFEGVIKSKAFLGRLYDCSVMVGEERIKVEIPSHMNVSEGEQIYIHLLPQFCVALPAE